jgi:hypothetical protein
MSAKNHVRRSLSSIQTSIRLAVSSNIVVPITHLVYGSQASRQLLVVVAQLADHFLRTHAFFVVVFEPLIARDIADRGYRPPSIEAIASIRRLRLTNSSYSTLH